MDNLIVELGITRARAGRYLGVNRATITRWCKTGAPVHVIKHFELLAGYKAALDAVRKA